MDTWNFPNELKLVASQYTNFTDAKDGFLVDCLKVG
jgi:hypothetical protein